MRRKLLGSQLILTYEPMIFSYNRTAIQLISLFLFLLFSESAVHYDVAEHESLGCCGYQTVGKESKSIPLSSITDVQIINPSSGCCACTKSLYLIFVQWCLRLMAFGSPGWNYGQLDIHTPSDPITGNSKHIQRTAEVVFPGTTLLHLCSVLVVECSLIRPPQDARTARSFGPLSTKPRSELRCPSCLPLPWASCNVCDSHWMMMMML